MSLSPLYLHVCFFDRCFLLGINVSEPYTNSPVHSCRQLRLGLTYTWIATFLFDFLIFFLTIVRTYALARTQTGFLRSGIVILVMRDGSIYFLCVALSSLDLIRVWLTFCACRVMSIVNAVNFILFRVSFCVNSGTPGG